jgi:tripartite-type tricarboxylate transporter receptor subunit TctC
MAAIWRLAGVLLFLVAPTGGAAAGSDAYPSHPIRIIVPYTPGGIADILARTVGQPLGDRLGQPVVVDNRPGAAGTLAADLVAKSPPDGYTLLLGLNATQSIAPSLYAHLPYDPLKDFQPITQIGAGPMVLLVNRTVPAPTVAALVALAKAKPGTLNYASAGNGAASHLAGALFAQSAGIELVHVPYKGTTPAVSDLLAGQVQIYFDPVVTAAPHVAGGALRALAVTSAHRVAALPDVPSMAEAGLPAVEFSAWFGLLAPAHIPPAVLARLHDGAVAVLSEPATRERLTAQGLDVVADAPDAFAAFIAADTEKMARIVRTAGVRIE